ncbi:hypothetical protein RF11_11324 [Thelohanellus kitauei]|uniref:BPTI/Kunitz inhibitor domain-containing protein n=1 Tax=Thelohanellus kitauei TaxID=669202 RepID=A0A0C2MA89_THEKT|nr:hypothetical protein RF11_11324 [Thelohanellus kitauei]
MNLIFVSSKCFKARHENDCIYNDNSTYAFFDIQTGFCKEYGTCGIPRYEVNMFWNLGDCKAECESPFRNLECLIDWDLSRDLAYGEIIMTKKAFNKYTGECELYIEEQEYPTPPLFDSYDECEEYCLIDPYA